MKYIDEIKGLSYKRINKKAVLIWKNPSSKIYKDIRIDNRGREYVREKKINMNRKILLNPYFVHRCGDHVKVTGKDFENGEIEIGKIGETERSDLLEWIQD